MAMIVDILSQAWIAYDVSERWNIGKFIIGLMFYKFGLEIFIGSIIPLAIDRFGERFFDCDESRNRSVPPGHLEAFRKVGILTGVNQAMQCVGTILVAPLIQRYQTRKVLLGATVVFALLTSILLMVDAAFGGRPRQWGDYNPVAIFPVYCISGIVYGMVELIRRVLPRELVGGDVSKLKRLDSVVHVFYEFAGTIGPIAAVKLIDSVGENLSFFLSPVSLALAGIVWFCIHPTENEHDPALPEDHRTESEHDPALPEDPAVEMAIPQAPVQEPGYLTRLSRHVALWGRSTWNGGALVLGSRRFIWLVPCYSFALLAHRYLENNIANIYAKGVMQKASYQPLIIVGSNLGELLGAIIVFFTADIIHSPLPFIRLDGLLLLLAWFIPFFPVSGNTLNDALSMAALFLPMSLTWAAGDVSLNAFLQSELINIQSRRPGVSTIASIMSFLYVTYIASYTLLSSVLGLLVDTVLGRDDPCSVDFRSNTRTALIYVGGIFFTVISFTILIATFIPGGACALNPLLWDSRPQEQIEELRNVQLGGPVGVQHVNRDTPTPPRDAVSIDTDGSEVEEQQPQPQSCLPSPTNSRPLPSPPFPTRRSHEAQLDRDTPTSPRSPISIDTDGSEVAQQQDQRQNLLPTLRTSRPLPSPPFPTRGPHDSQRQSALPSPTRSAPQPSPPFSAHGPHYP